MTPTPDERLVGRDEELTSLVERLDAVHHGGVVLGLVGEPGVGKSALLAGVTEHARAAGFRVLAARGAHAEAHLPFAALHQLVRPLLPRADRLPEHQRESLLACFAMGDSLVVNPFFSSLAVLELLVDAAAEAPVLVCLDDLHRMDQPSVDALAFVARRIGSERIAMVCASPRPSAPFTDDDAVAWFEVRGLDEAASATLLDARAPGLMPAVRDRIVGHADGNPLALRELAVAVQQGRGWTDTDDEMPMTARLEQAFVARADELDVDARLIVDLAALNDGDDVDEVLAAAASLRPSAGRPAAAAPALDLGLLTVDGDTYRIAHPLVGSALRHAMPAAARREAHAALARVLSAHPDRAVAHRASSASGPDEQIATELEKAATDAQRRGATATAVAWFERAAALSPAPEGRAARLLSAAELGYELGRFAQVEQITAQVSTMSLQVRERSRLTWLAGVFHDGSTSEPAEIRHLVDLSRRARSDDDTDLAMQLLFGAARRVWWRDPGPEVRDDIVRAAHEVGLAAGDPRLLAVLGLSESLETAPAVVGHLEQWPADAGGRPDLAGLLGIAAFCVGDFGRADSFLSAAIQELRTHGRLGLLAEALALRSWAEINLGIFDASRSADEARRLADETGQAVWAATARLALVVDEALSGGWDVHHPLLAEAEDTASRTPNASSSLLAAAQFARGVAALGAERPEPAYGELHRVFVPTDPACQRVQQLWTISYLADAAAHAGRREEAAGLLTGAERLAGDSPATGPTIALEYSRAVLAEPATAEKLFRAALDGAGPMYPWHHARLQLAHGSWLRRQHRTAESRAPLRAARTTFDAAGARPWARRADRELRATGERGWRPAQRPREQLSPQEAQIAELAAQGLSNREIGQRLFLSHRTVGSHLYRVFPKLGVTSRTQLPAVLSHRD
ncbi:regulatory LuxR family protein [Actinomycetospora succinea]|uniref:Regulatory LuxR family protein n=1 Tax=Actinomycetospora succinea TaxID=663603 RepID=A0A4V3D794_9PSEU|nr:LuxR family transcriptional regulator [Actinomycetospora succinea]TDQ46987.1 regulatory LuxR family protein [Actinomycetospora succinea]